MQYGEFIAQNRSIQHDFCKRDLQKWEIKILNCGNGVAPIEALAYD